MSNETVKAEIAKTVLSIGIPVLKDESFYGWKDNTAMHHAKGLNKETRQFEEALVCKWVVPETIVIEEVYVSEFTDTFNDANEDMMIQVFGVSCTCGEHTDKKIRYEGTFGELLSILLQD